VIAVGCKTLLPIGRVGPRPARVLGPWIRETAAATPAAAAGISVLCLRYRQAGLQLHVISTWRCPPTLWDAGLMLTHFTLLKVQVTQQNISFVGTCRLNGKQLDSPATPTPSNRGTTPETRPKAKLLLVRVGSHRTKPPCFYGGSGRRAQATECNPCPQDHRASGSNKGNTMVDAKLNVVGAIGPCPDEVRHGFCR
jgi:hypothetical protein